MNKKTATVEHMAIILGIGRATAYELAHDPSFYPAFRIGRKILINLDRLDEWMKEQGAKAV